MLFQMSPDLAHAALGPTEWQRATMPVAPNGARQYASVSADLGGDETRLVWLERPDLRRSGGPTAGGRAGAWRGCHRRYRLACARSNGGRPAAEHRAGCHPP